MNIASSKTKSKEIADYYECISRAVRSYDFEYLLVLEDDAELMDGRHMDSIVNQLLPTVAEKHSDVAVLKLFYSSRFQGFALEFQPIVDLLAAPLLVLFMCYWLTPRKMRETLSMSHFTVSATVFGGWYLTILLIFVSLGRQNSILPLRKKLLLQRIERPASSGMRILNIQLYLAKNAISPFVSGSTVANLYPRKFLPKVLELLNSMKCSGERFELDLQMSDLLRSNGMESAWIQDQYFNHMGFQSSLDEKSATITYASVLDSYGMVYNKGCD